MIQTLAAYFIDAQSDKNKSAHKNSRANLWSTLSWAKDDPKKGHRLSLQVHGTTITKQ